MITDHRASEPGGWQGAVGSWQPREGSPSQRAALMGLELLHLQEMVEIKIFILFDFSEVFIIITLRFLSFVLVLGKIM